MSPLGGAKLVLAVLLVGAWLALLGGTGALGVGAVAVALFLGLGLWRPRLALGALVAFAAATPMFAALAGLSWFSAAEGGLLALWLAVAWRERSAPRRPLDLAGTVVLLFGLYVVLATLALVVRYRYPSWALGLSLLQHPLADLLQLKQGQSFYGFRAGTLLLEGLLAFLLARRVDSEPGAGRATLWGLWTGGCLASLSYFFYYLPRLLEPSKNWVTYRPALTLHDPNSAASFGLLVLGAGLAMALRRPKAWPVYLLPGLFILFMGGSRAAYLIALAGCLGIVGVVLWVRRKTGEASVGAGGLSTRSALAPALVVLLILGAAVGFLSFRSKHFQRLVSGEVFTADRFSGRLDLWGAGLGMVADWPLSGVGASEFPLALRGYLKEEPGVDPALGRENAHCYPLQLAAEYGVPGLLLWAGLLYVILVPRARQWRVLSPESAGLLVGTAFYLLHCLQSHPLLLPEQQILFWTALGGLAGGFSKLQEPRGPSALRWVAALCLLAPLWSLTQPLPTAAAARAFGLYSVEQSADGYDWRWTGPEAWMLVEKPGRWLLKVDLPRPDFGKRQPRLRVEVGGAVALDRSFQKPEPLEITLEVPPGAAPPLLHVKVEPPFVPREWQTNQDSRLLGAWIGLPQGILDPGPRGSETGAPGLPVTVSVAGAGAPEIPLAARVASCSVEGLPSRVAPGEHFSVRLRFKNAGSGPWPAGALRPTARALNASNHWTDETGEMVVWDGPRMGVESDVPPGGSAIVQLEAVAPTVSGRYLFVPDLVQENVGWFSSALEGGPYAVEVAP